VSFAYNNAVKCQAVKSHPTGDLSMPTCSCCGGYCGGTEAVMVTVAARAVAAIAVVVVAVVTDLSGALQKLFQVLRLLQVLLLLQMLKLF
jgi:hypothetical protein